MENNNSANAGNSASPLSKKDNRTLMGILAYLGPFIIVSYLMAKDDPFVKFHIKQGLVLLIIDILVAILSPMLWPLSGLLNLLILVLLIIGIINVVQGDEKELPVVGQFSRYFKF